MNSCLTGSNNILLIGKKSSSNDLLSNNLITQVTSLNNIETKYTFANTCTESDLTAIFEKQQQFCEPVLLYLNDCINIEIVESEIFNNLILKGRHFNIFIVLSLQYPINFCPEIRSNFDLTFICKEGIATIKTKLYDRYFGFIPSIEEFNGFIETLNKDEFLYSKDNKLYNYSIISDV
jgi:hypothetical protein